MDITENIELCPDKLGVPIKVGDKVVYAMSEKVSQIYIGKVIGINTKHYTNYDRTEVKILTDKTKREITRINNSIIGLQPIYDRHPEYFI